MTTGLKYAAIAVLFLLGLTGCPIMGRHKTPVVQTPPAPVPVEAEAEVKPPPPKVEPLPGPAPKIDTAKTPVVPPAVASIPNPPAPKPKKKPKKPAATAATGTVQSPPAAAAQGENGTPPAPAVTVPKLGEILSDEQKLQYQKMCDESLNRARGSLALLKGHWLSSDQKQTFIRINGFIDQAEQVRDKDPQTARQLAERADLLSRDLAKTVR